MVLYMVVFFYNCNDTNNKIHKHLEQAETHECILKRIDDVCELSLDILSDTPIEKNYAYIPNFRRYYFITRIESVRNGLWRVNLSVDVLTTYATSIDATNATITTSMNPDTENMDKETKINETALETSISNPFTYSNIVMIGID